MVYKGQGDPSALKCSRAQAEIHPFQVGGEEVIQSSGSAAAIPDFFGFRMQEEAASLIPGQSRLHFMSC